MKEKFQKRMWRFLLHSYHMWILKNSDNSSTKDDVPESLVEVHGVGDGVVPLQGDHSCNIKGIVSRERNKV